MNNRFTLLRLCVPLQEFKNSLGIYFHFQNILYHWGTTKNKFLLYLSSLPLHRSRYGRSLLPYRLRYNKI
ncbi:MAG: hypothetical protein LBJ00_11620 [Planctomycetaceae bacterium]|nr:hypothetical protein [Planctomycetaceae bacterium]